MMFCLNLSRNKCVRFVPEIDTFLWLIFIPQYWFITIQQISFPPRLYLMFISIHPQNKTIIDYSLSHVHLIHPVYLNVYKASFKFNSIQFCLAREVSVWIATRFFVGLIRSPSTQSNDHIHSINIPYHTIPYTKHNIYIPYHTKLYHILNITYTFRII